MAAMSKTIGAVYEFGSFRLDSARRLLMQNDRTLTLPPKTFDLLILLVESRGRVLTKKELMSALWPDTFVEDANLTFQMSAVRKALGPEAGNWIETLPRYGYRFTDKVLEVHPGFTSGGAVPLLPETPAALRGTELADSAFWSPDGSSLAFFAAGKLKRLDLPGGSPQIMCETPVGRSSGTWSRSGAFRSDCEKFRIAKNIVSNLAGGSPRFPFTYFNQTPGRGRVHIGTHW